MDLLIQPCSSDALCSDVFEFDVFDSDFKVSPDFPLQEINIIKRDIMRRGIEVLRMGISAWGLLD